MSQFHSSPSPARETSGDAAPEADRLRVWEADRTARLRPGRRQIPPALCPPVRTTIMQLLDVDRHHIRASHSRQPQPTVSGLHTRTPASLNLQHPRALLFLSFQLRPESLRKAFPGLQTEADPTSIGPSPGIPHRPPRDTHSPGDTLPFPVGTPASPSRREPRRKPRSSRVCRMNERMNALTHLSFCNV